MVIRVLNVGLLENKKDENEYFELIFENSKLLSVLPRAILNVGDDFVYRKDNEIRLRLKLILKNFFVSFIFIRRKSFIDIIPCF